MTVQAGFAVKMAANMHLLYIWKNFLLSWLRLIILWLCSKKNLSWECRS